MGESPAGPGEPGVDLHELQQAFEVFTRTTRSMEEAYRGLESRVQELDQELALTIDYLNYILESMSDGVIAVDTEYRVTTFNKAASAVLGYNPIDVIGRRFNEVFGREFGAGARGQVRELPTGHGQPIKVSERDSPIADRDGQRIGTVKVFQDLTEIEELRSRVAQQERLAAIGEMAATVAHEIRNPLGGIRGFAALLARDLDEDDPRRRLVDKIQIGSKELERVVSELLEYTRPVQLRVRATGCRDLVEAALGYLEPGKRTVAIENNVNTETRVLVDSDKMRQVLLNVLLNAVQSIESDGAITIAADEVDGLIALSMRDSGCGMTEEQAAQAFTPFFTTKEKGTGLGLAVAQKIVEGHGGWIELESEVGAGTTMIVYLPVAE